MGYFALRRDKAAVFSPSGKAAVTYRVVNGVSLAPGDPVRAPEAGNLKDTRKFIEKVKAPARASSIILDSGGHNFTTGNGRSHPHWSESAVGSTQGETARDRDGST
ncbi:phosphatidylglycerol lysyltransferase domain-containing protein [Streptomyces sp. LNU-CPARS28]|uniref:phosphatidylglycerol lysyltransferase domain-containing protein n=1 Tax=Streptomyces sp. LNU-CPARS28 TaxID=3137371 RepID=UPI003135653C